MSLLGFIILVIVAAVAGAIGQSLVGFSRGGCLVSAFVGLVGAYLGMWLSQALGLPELFALNIDGQPFPIVWAIIGATLFAAVLSLLFGRRYRV